MFVLIAQVTTNNACLQVILMAGLQGVGKTTACGKLALYLKGQGKRVSMVATDVYRPAAIDQLVRCCCPFVVSSASVPDECMCPGSWAYREVTLSIRLCIAALLF